MLPATVLDGFDLAPSRISPVHGGLETSVWRVDTPERSVSVRRVGHAGADERFVASELAWLNTVSNTPGVAPRPLKRQDGILAPVVETDPTGNVLALWTALEWVEGESLGRMPTAREAMDIGGLIAEVHDCSKAWTPQANFARPVYDSFWFRNAASDLLANEAVRPSASDRSIIGTALDSACVVLDRLWTKERDVGMIHADIHDGNVLWSPNAARPTVIDFGRCGVGPFVLDVAMAQHYVTSDVGEHLRIGYQQRRPDSALDRSVLDHLRFIAAVENLAILSAFSDKLAFVRAAMPGLVKQAEQVR